MRQFLEVVPFIPYPETEVQDLPREPSGKQPRKRRNYGKNLSFLPETTHTTLPLWSEVEKLWFLPLPQKCVPKVTPAVSELAGSSSTASGSVGDRPLTAMALLLPQATPCFSFLFACWLFSQYQGQVWDVSNSSQEKYLGFTSPTPTPSASAPLPWIPVRRGRDEEKEVSFMCSVLWPLLLAGFFCSNNVDKLSAHCFSPQWWPLPQTHRHPPPTSNWNLHAAYWRSQ